MRYLTTFATLGDYKLAKKEHKLQIPAVSFIKDEESIRIDNSFTTKEEAEAGDIVVYSKSAYEKWRIADASEKEKAFNDVLNSVKYVKAEMFDEQMADSYLPDSIVVIPSSHTGDGTVKVMSLKYMNVLTPETGSNSSSEIVWGYENDITGLVNENKVVSMVDTSMGSASTLASVNNSNLPSDSFDGLEVEDGNSVFYWASSEGNHAPCPYDGNDKFNKQYIGEYGSEVLVENALGDLGGRYNTETILRELDTEVLQDTLFANSIANSSTQTVNAQATPIFPAAMVCQRYSTVLKPNVVSYNAVSGEFTFGDWYLPCAGELGYVIVNKDKIKYSIDKINEAISDAAATYSDSILYSSTENGTSAWMINPANGEVSSISKAQGKSIRAFASM